MSLSVPRWLLVFLLVAAPVWAQTIYPGFDLWETSDGSRSYVDIPMDFFCSGSQARPDLLVEWVGEPLDANSLLGGTDTVIERPSAAAFSNGQASVPIVLRALSLRGKDVLSVPECAEDDSTWSLTACPRALSSAEEAAFTTQLTVTLNAAGDGGTYSGSLRVPVRLVFTNGAGREVEMTSGNDVDFSIVGADWSEQPGSEGIEIVGQVSVDDGCVNSPAPLTVSGPTNFYPGWRKDGATITRAPPSHMAPAHAHTVSPPSPVDPCEEDCGDDDGGGGSDGGGGCTTTCRCSPLVRQTPIRSIVGSTCLEAQVLLWSLLLQDTGCETCFEELVLITPCFADGSGGFRIAGYLRYSCELCVCL